MEEAQQRLQVVKHEKVSIDEEVQSKETEIETLEEQLKQSQVDFEKEQLKLLTYRKEDILDLLNSLKNMQNVQNEKKRAELLENELLKIDNELYELESKYGQFKIRKILQ